MLNITRWGNPDSMTTRSAVIVTIGIIATLMVAVALAALFAGDISERTLTIITSVLGSLATVLAGLLLFLRVETLNSKADEAATKAGVAADKATVVEEKVDRVTYDLHNGGLRDNIIKAIEIAEERPSIQRKRIETTQKGVQADRHESGSREQAAYARGVADAERRWRERLESSLEREA